MPRELKPGFVPIQSNIPPTSEIETKESAPLPSTLKEFREATENALDFGDKHLGLWTADGTELSTIAFEEWTSVSMELDETFFELRDGILGTQLLNFASLDDAELVQENIRREIESLLAQTAPLARRMNPLIDRLCAVNPTMTRADVIAALHEGEILATETVDYTSKQPHRKSLLGILHDLGERIESRVWSFENTTISDLTPVVILSDPFSKDAESLSYWSERGGTSILKRSEQKTQSIIYELENLRQTMEGNGEKRNVMDALTVIEDWLESNMILYRDGKEVDFELYHLGMEEPQEVDAIFGSLDIIKHDNPEFFVQLMGINPEGGKSPYFGSFIHKALFNTQKTLNDIVTEAPNLVMKSSMKQLLRIDGTVQRWNFTNTISEEGLKEIARRMEERIAVEPTESGKNQIRMLWATMLAKPTIELAVKRQLEAMKEVNFKQIKTELLAKLDDHERPMLALKAISTLPLVAFRDGEIKKRMTEIFGEESMEDVADLQSRCREKEDRAVRAIFNQIPVFDYEKGASTNFLRIVVGEAMVMESFGEATARRLGYSDDIRLKFLQNILDGRPGMPSMVLTDFWAKERKAFFKEMQKKQKELSRGTRFYREDLEGKEDSEIPREYHTLYLDKGVYDAYENLFHVMIGGEKGRLEKLKEKREARTAMSEQELTDEHKMCMALAFMNSSRLMEEFGSFRLRKSDAAKVVKVIFEHLPELTSYEKFEFLLKHAEKFEEENVRVLLKAVRSDVDFFRAIILHMEEEYPPVFSEFIQRRISEGSLGLLTTNTEKKSVFIGTIVESLLDEDDLGEGDLWTEEHIINFARTPGFDEVFAKYAKKIFEMYPNLPVKLYGEWGARMIKENGEKIELPFYLEKIAVSFPKDANDRVRERYEKLQLLRKSMGTDWGSHLKYILEEIIEEFEQEFPEATSESYREMREVFGGQLLGFTEVEQAFTNKSGRQWMVIGEEERKRAVVELDEKLHEPEIARFIKNAKENPNRERDIALIYRVDIGARPEEERKRITAFLPAEHLTPGWHFVRISELQSSREDNRIYDTFVLDREYPLQDKDSPRGRFFLV